MRLPVGVICSCESYFRFTCSTHAMDATVILRCEDCCIPSRAWSKRCERCWYSVMMGVRTHIPSLSPKHVILYLRGAVIAINDTFFTQNRL